MWVAQELGHRGVVRKTGENSLDQHGLARARRADHRNVDVVSDCRWAPGYAEARGCGASVKSVRLGKLSLLTS